MLITGNVYISFNIVTTKTYQNSDHIGPPPVSNFIIANKEVFVPNWLIIEIKKMCFAENMVG
jgi:hypothetical protein